jgi:hypothetical protein
VFKFFFFFVVSQSCEHKKKWRKIFVCCDSKEKKRVEFGVVEAKEHFYNQQGQFIGRFEFKSKVLLWTCALGA